MPLSAIQSVKNDELDAEHEECEAALNTLAQSRAPAALAAVHQIFVRHFQHEEDMLNDHLYSVEEARLRKEGGTSLLLDSKRSHYRDHEKMIQKVADEHARATKAGDLVSSAFVDQLFRAFEHHANIYDGHYADKLAAAMA